MIIGNETEHFAHLAISEHFNLAWVTLLWLCETSKTSVLESRLS